ncbi:peptidase inhibitor family I36 protein [Streptomyces winkii]|uniref:peptidase inhibitor family I36 protein n=1 Tax=Streptomyces winkii TaxID=3051178 RepID=UPI0028D8E2E7|nr:peptidase inhibitor family I36 protein [Streptomyces sp. DSM 40971]
MRMRTLAATAACGIALAGGGLTAAHAEVGSGSPGGGLASVEEADGSPSDGLTPVKGASSVKKKWKHCPKGALCLYTKQGGQGTVYRVWGATNKNFKHISSAWNNGKSQGPENALTKIQYNGHTQWTCWPQGYRASGVDRTVDAVRWKESGCG